MARSLFRIIIILSAILAAAPAIAATAREVVSWCTNATDPRPKLCETYLLAAFDLLRSEEPDFNGGGRACVPDGEPIGAVTPMLAEWLERNPDGGDTNAFDAFAPLFREKYPCVGE